MTFTEKVKNEITLQRLSENENRYLFLGYIYANATFENDKIFITLENINIAKKIFKTVKYCYFITPKITVRYQKKFKVQRLFILEVSDSKKNIESELMNLNLIDEDNKKSFLKGLFLATGSINNPNKNSYHLELNFQNENKSTFVLNLLNKLNFNFKLLKRNKSYMLYLKSGEQISDFLKILEVVKELFYFEDIRILRDHKNMVNRLNNCEQANYEKSLETGNKQIKIIEFLKNNNYYDLLDEKTREVADLRLKYSEESYQSFANIMSSELNKKITKSYVNHHLRKLNDFYTKIINKE